MKEIDKQIRELLKKEKFEENPIYSEQLIHMTEELVKKSRNTKKNVHKNSLYRKYIPAAIFTVILAAYPVKAATDYVAARLAKVSEEENKDLRTVAYENEGQDNSVEKEAICYPGDFAESEQEPPADVLSEDEAVASAAFYMEKMYGISTENMEYSLNSDSGNYQITFTADRACYSVCIQADDGTFVDISMEREGFIYYQDDLKATKSAIRKKGKEAKAIAAQLLREEIMITDAYAQYKLNTKNRIPHGSVVYLFDLEDGNRLRMSYSIAEDVLWGAAIEKGGAGHKDWNVKNDEKRVFLRIEDF